MSLAGVDPTPCGACDVLPLGQGAQHRYVERLSTRAAALARPKQPSIRPPNMGWTTVGKPRGLQMQRMP